MTVTAAAPVLRAEQVSFAPNLFKATKLKPSEATIAAYHLLQTISFEVFPGDRIGIVGASGAGKTTLLRLLNRLSEPTSGTLYLASQPYTQIPPVQLRQQIALVLQESKLLGMTVQEALEYPLQLRGIPKQEMQHRLGEWLERLQIPLEWLSRTEQQLSVGQRQLVAIARALVTQPKVLLLDEPTSALDSGRIQLLFKELTDLSERQQTTILMVNHQLDLVQKLATRVFHLHQGQLIQDEATHQLDWVALEQHLQVLQSAQAEEWI